MSKLRVFVSSVQKELESERLAVLQLISSDPFLTEYCEAVLYELEPASPKKAIEEALDTVGTCDIYLGIIWKAYGSKVGELSITHREYRAAKEKRLPPLIYIKGSEDLKRDAGTETLIKEIRQDGFKYKRFANFPELQHEIRESLVGLLKMRGIEPSSDENQIAERTIDAASKFESQPLKRITWEQMDHEVARELIANAEQRPPNSLSDAEVLNGLVVRGLISIESGTATNYATAAGVVLLGKDPSVAFPHCRILADAYLGKEPDAEPADHTDIRGPMPLAIQKAVSFVDKNTRHPMRVTGLNRIRLDEYPVEALREALVNAIAHRDYEDGSRKITLEVFADRVVVSSPGLPPRPLTVQKLRSGKYKPCSRNPILAQCLSYFHRIEERGSGFRRMREQMIDHGLDAPRLGTESGYFQVVFPGPGKDLRRLRIPSGASGQLVSPSIEAQLSKRQRDMVRRLVRGEELTSRRCQELYGISPQALHGDFQKLVSLGLAERTGSGRSARYVLGTRV
jgi:ATP-dependent DNA helicase RecG